MMQPFLRDASTEILRAIRKRAGKASLIVEDIRSRPWASATFSGARHRVTFRLEGPDAEDHAAAFLAGIEAAEFSLRGHILADIRVAGRDDGGENGVRIELEALTVEDA